eukprot:SAG31_NODE_26997_length_433_cov_0.458084_2_plen_49_part_01
MELFLNGRTFLPPAVLPLEGLCLVGFTHIRMESWDLSSSMGFTIAMVLR